MTTFTVIELDNGGERWQFWYNRSQTVNVYLVTEKGDYAGARDEVVFIDMFSVEPGCSDERLEAFCAEHIREANAQDEMIDRAYDEWKDEVRG